MTVYCIRTVYCILYMYEISYSSAGAEQHFARPQFVLSGVETLDLLSHS